MGVERKIIVVDRSSENYSEIIAVFNLGNMGYDFPVEKLFENDFASKIFIEDGNHETNVDRYGNKIRYTKNISKLVDYFKELNKKQYYRRFNPIIGLLNGLNLSDWTDLQILHYAY